MIGFVGAGLARTPDDRNTVGMSSDDLPRSPDLPTAFRGYARNATDAFLFALEESFHRLTAERDQLRVRVEELGRELAHHEQQVQAVGDALVGAQIIAATARAQAELEAEEIVRDAEARKSEAVREAADIRARAEQDAAATIRDAEATAARVVAEMQRGIEEHEREAQTLDDTRERLSSFVRDLLGRVTSGQVEPAATVSDAPAHGSDDP